HTPTTASLFPYTTLFRSFMKSAASSAVLQPRCARSAASGRGRFSRHWKRCSASASSHVLNFQILLIVKENSAAPHGSTLFHDHRSEEHTSELQSRENLVC